MLQVNYPYLVIPRVFYVFITFLPYLSSSHSTAFLGKPNWSTNKLAWHALLSICGFFVAQVFALTAWNIFSQTSPTKAKIYIVFWSLLGTATLTGTLKAAFEDNDTLNLPVSYQILRNIMKLILLLTISSKQINI